MATLNRRPNGMTQGSSRDQPAKNIRAENSQPEQSSTEPEYTNEQKEAVNKWVLY